MEKQYRDLEIGDKLFSENLEKDTKVVSSINLLTPKNLGTWNPESQIISRSQTLFNEYNQTGIINIAEPSNTFGAMGSLICKINTNGDNITFPLGAEVLNNDYANDSSAYLLIITDLIYTQVYSMSLLTEETSAQLEDVIFQNISANLTATGNSIEKIANSGSYGDTATSTQSVSVGSYEKEIVFEASPSGLVGLIGFTDTATPTDYTDFNFSILISGATVNFFELGVKVVDSPYLRAAGDISKITINTSGDVKYYNSTDGGNSFTLLYTSLTTASGSYYFGVDMNIINQEVFNAQISK